MFRRKAAVYFCEYFQDIICIFCVFKAAECRNLRFCTSFGSDAVDSSLAFVPARKENKWLQY